MTNPLDTNPADVLESSPTELTRNAARDVLGWSGSLGGWATGGFTVKLLDAISSADGHNRYLLESVYPELVAAFRLFADTEDGIDILTEMAQG